jgi:uncharacterized protein
VLHRTPNLSALLEKAKNGDSAQDVQAYLDAGGLATTVVELQGATALVTVPLLHNVASRNAHPHRELAETVRLLVDAGADINAPSKYSETLCSTALMCAVARKCCTIVSAVLLHSGADPCVTISGSLTTLHRAAASAYGLTASCKLLLEHSNTLLEARDSCGKTALQYAAEAGRLDNVRLLLQYGADVNTLNNRSASPLIAACLQQHVSIAACLLKAGAMVNTAAADGNCALIAAVESGSVALVQLLLDNGADISATNNDGQNALFRAAHAGHVLLLEFLVQRGLSVNSTDTVGRTALMMAVIGGQKAAECLIQHGAAVNSDTLDGYTALHAACAGSSSDDAAMIELLLANGADLHMCNKLDCTPLIVAACYGKLQCAKALIAAGADANHINYDGHYALHLAISGNHAAVAQLLLAHSATAVMNSVTPSVCFAGVDCCTQATALMMCSTADTLKVVLAAGADVHVTTDNGDTCLHKAAAHGYVAPVVCLLIKAGVDLHAVNKEGKIAAQLAHDTEHTLIEQLLNRAAQQQER